MHESDNEADGAGRVGPLSPLHNTTDNSFKIIATLTVKLASLSCNTAFKPNTVFMKNYSLHSVTEYYFTL